MIQIDGHEWWPRPDEQLQELMGRSGELPLPGNNRWGNAVLLKGGATYTFVNVGMDAGNDYPTPMAIAVEFSTDGVNYTPSVPTTVGVGTLTVTLIKAVDVKAKGPLIEATTLSPGQALPFCTFLARGITVVVSNDGEGATPVFVHVTVAPTTMVDCQSISNPVAGAYSSATATRLPATAATVYHVAAQPTRAQLYIQNRSAQDLFINFGSTVSVTPGAELATIVLPGGISAITENAGYQGPVTLEFAGTDAAGYALVTTGVL
jgi:hypothetical protein